MNSSLLTRIPLASLAVLLGSTTILAQEPLSGSINVHDPCALIKHGNRYYTFHTGNNIASKWSTNGLNWSNGSSVFSTSTRPGWTTNAVPGFTGNFWAPDVIYINGLYHVYYSVSTFGSQVSAIGLVTSPSLNPAVWTDQGPVIQSGNVNYNAIDPSVLLASDGRLWMAFGSFWDGIKMIELDPATGKRIAPSSTIFSLARRSSGSAIEAPFLFQRGNFYYLFVNWDTCCSGLGSTYQIRVGRSTTITGPYRDRNNLIMASGGGTLFLESTGKFIGPGHAGIFVEGGTNWFTYHYYDGTTGGGTARLGMGRLHWTEDDWPVLTNDWNAFYPFEADAREHRRQFDGTLQNGAATVAEPNRGRVLELDGSTQHVRLPLSVANAGTFAAWIQWNGGGGPQRIFDFGAGTGRYLFLTPSNSANGRLRFTIKSAASGEQNLDGPAALPLGTWAHVAVTIEGTRGLLYLNGKPVATNNVMTVRPWQVQARTNYIGQSQFTLHPRFNGRIDSLRTYGRALTGAEVKELSESHPALAHRYSFASDARDSIGGAHGQLRGNAVVTNQALSLDGTSGTFVALHGGLVTGCSAVTLEFWATFRTSGPWARVFDFGNTSGGNGQNFLFFTPRTASDTHRFAISTSGGARNHDADGVLNEQTVHVACIADPAAGYTAIYTNGILESEMTGSLPALSTVNSALSYIGRSLFSADAWLDADIHEFRIYHGRLTPKEIAVNHASGPDALAIPVELATSKADDELTLSWPSYAAGFFVEGTDLPFASESWSALPGTPASFSNAYWFTLPTTNQAGIFRLRR